jgi:hypothetical protein
MLDSQTRRANSGTARESYRIFSILALFAISVATLFVVSVSSHSGGPNRLGESGQRTKHRISARPSSGSLRSAPSAATLVAPLLVSITVDRTDDVAAASACTAAANDCSLRGAVAFANIIPATTIIVPAGTYQLPINVSSEGFAGDNSIGDLDITQSTTAISGAGAATTIIQQTQPNDRVIEVNPFLDAGFVTDISGVTITGGKETTGTGGGGIVAGSIANALTVTNCVISGNSATGAGTFGGGGISFTGGSLTVSGTTFSSNSTTGSGGGVAYSAGDLLGRTPSVGVFSVTNSNFSSNSANGGGGGATDLFDFNLGSGSYSFTSTSFSSNAATTGNGGAILVESGGPLTVTTSSLSTNSAGNFGGAIFSNAPVATVRYSRLVGNTVPLPVNGLTIFRNSGLFTADDNWWGINTGPSANDFRSPAGTIMPTTYLQLRASASPSAICVGDTSTISADIKQRNTGPALTVELNGLPPFPATFINTTPAVGSLSGVSASFVDGAASATFTGSTTGTANIDVIADNETETATVIVGANTTTSDPADVAVCQGATANFSTTASGTGPFSYAWTLDGSPFNGDSASINVPTGSLSVGNHTVAVTTTGACGSASQSATLTVQAPTATTDPADQAVCKGATANFSTTASGTGPFHYAWTLDGVPFNGDSASISVPTGSLSSGPHTVAVTTSGMCGSASQSATLTVGSPPVITLTTSNINMWPPNHAYHTFTASDFGASASGCDGDLTSSIVIASISSDEPEDNLTGADGTTLNDIVIAADCKSTQLRIERDADLNGRVYTITFRVRDSQGNETTATATVSVPIDQSGGSAINGPGPGYTVTSACP